MAERTPLHESATRAGAEWEEKAGWLMPGHFGDPDAEYQAALSGAALFDVSSHGKIELAGKDAGSFLHNLCTNDITGVAVGAGCETFLTTAKAKVVSHALVYHVGLPESWWLDVDPGMAEPTFQHLNRYLISEQVELLERTRELAQLHLAGPEAGSLLEKVLGGALDLKELHHVTRPVADAGSCQIRRHDPLGLPGYDLLCLSSQAGRVWQLLLQTRARPAGNQAYEILRVEAGTPVYGVDITDAILAQEVNRTERAISYRKGCYLGQETIVRTRDLGHVNWLLLGVKISGNGPVAPGTKLIRNGEDVGRITSSVVSPRCGSTIGLAYVRRGSQEVGTKFDVIAADGQRSAELVGPRLR